MFGERPRESEASPFDMNTAPSAVDTETKPPVALPLAHVAVGLCFLVLWGGVTLAATVDLLPGLGRVAGRHLFLLGWVCVTIVGAMTLFVPVWSGTRLHSRRLAWLQLWLVTVGVAGLATCLLGSFLGGLPLFGLLALAGLWTFVYNVGRTLPPLRSMDVTERHFALALGWVIVATLLGVTLAVDLVRPTLGATSPSRPNVVAAHATLAVFGVVLTTVVGALFQLGPMFTQTDLDAVDTTVQRVETWAYPTGVGALAAGRLAGHGALARLGGVLLAASLLGVGVVLARRLRATRVRWTPVISRYAVVAGAFVVWAGATLPAWLADPLSPAHTLGGASLTRLLTLGVIAFVVSGTLYHVVPFLVWEAAYGDRLGLEAVPMVDDLYDDRVAALDLAAFLLGTGVLVSVDAGFAPTAVAPVGAALLLVGATLLAVNLCFVVVRHAPGSIRGSGDDAGEDGRDAGSDGPESGVGGD